MSVSTRIGTLGRCDAMMRALNPLFVNTITHGALSICTAALLAAAIANSVETVVVRDARSSRRDGRGCFSISRMMRCIASTARRGYSPAAVSADNITASVPKNGVGHVARLGACRARIVDHRLQHLRCRNHRPPRLIGDVDDPLLRERHFF